MRPGSPLRPFGRVWPVLLCLHLAVAPAMAQNPPSGRPDGPKRPPAMPANVVAQPAWSFESNVANQQLGFIATTAADVNGDGYSDVIALGTVGLTQVALYLFLGGPSGPTLAPGYPVTNIPSGSPITSLNAAGDLNGDGFADIVMGFPATNSGSFRVYYGSSAGLDLAHPFNYSLNFAPTFGQVVGPAGDVNGDGFDDLIVGSPGMGPASFCGGGSTQGRVDVYYGSASGLRTDNPWVLWGCEWFATGTGIGASAGTAGDVNGDGFDDIVIGGNGVACVVYGAAGGLPIRPNSFGEGWLSGATTVNAFHAGDGTGLAACGAGDLNGDGYADVLIGSPNDNTYATGCGWARAFLGGPSGLQTGSTFWEESSTSASAHFGGTLAAAGDLNGDGLADVLVGEASRIGVFKSAGSTLLSTTNPIVVASTLRCFATAGDVNGDGLSDIVVGDGTYSNGQSSEGHLLYFAGRGDGPSTTPSWSMKTMLTGANLGWSVSSAGDVNGDGLDDILVGAPTLPNIGTGGVNNGGAFLDFGRISGPTPGLSDWSFLGSPGDQAGIAVAPAYDINGDGFADFLVGGHGGGTQPGKVFVFYGHANPWSSTSTPDLVLTGTQSAGQFGSVLAAGDFNGDGYADIAVGAPYNDVKTFTQAGQVFVYLGGPGGLNPTPAITLSGTQANEHYGFGLAADADVNGDGFTDLIVSAPEYDGKKYTDEGALFEFHGGLSPVLTFIRTIEGTAAGFGLGHSLAHAGDVNGDGYGDIIAGMPFAGTGGRAEVYAGGPSGLGTSPVWAQDGFEANSAFGASVSCAGDVDGDGLSDVVVGAVFEDGGGPTDCGAVRAFLGPLSSGSPAYWIARGTLPFQNLGTAANAGDVNGDGWSDLLFGEPGFSQDLNRQGNCDLYLGAGGLGRFELGDANVGGQTVQLLGLSSPTSFDLVNFARSAAGRTRVRMQWDVENVAALDGPTFAGIQPTYTPTNTPGSLGSYAVLAHTVSGLGTGQPCSWRMRNLSRSVYFPTGPWLSPTRNGAKEYDLRSPGSWAGVRATPAAPVALELSAAQPNPTPARSTVTFALPSPGHVRLSILDVQGRRLRTLADGVLPAGLHEASWDGFSEGGVRAAAGVYFYRLEAADRCTSRKVALLP